MHKTGGPITRKVLGVRGRATSRFVQNDLAGVLGYVATSENGPINFKHKEKFFSKKTGGPITRKVLRVRGRATSRFVQNRILGVLGYVTGSENGPINFKHKEKFFSKKTGGPITRKVLRVRGRATSRFVQNQIVHGIGYVRTP